MYYGSLNPVKPVFRIFHGKLIVTRGFSQANLTKMLESSWLSGVARRGFLPPRTSDGNAPDLAEK